MNHRTQTKNDMCEVCGQRRKFVERGVRHPYCGKTCAKQAQPSSTTVCRLHGCVLASRPMFVGFCSEIHSKEAVRSHQVSGCTQCNYRPSVKGNLCAVCERELRLEELDQRKTVFQSLASQVKDTWEPSNSGVDVQKIFNIINPQASQSRFEEHRQKLLSIGPVENLPTFYSSQCVCNLGYRDSEICDKPSCGICAVLRSSFRSLAFGKLNDNGRHGKGIYSYLNPAHADKHSTACTSSPYLVMISCEVVKPKAANTSLFPMRLTSDIDDVFVNNSDAIIARHVILYTKQNNHPT